MSFCHSRTSRQLTETRVQNVFHFTNTPQTEPFVDWLYLDGNTVRAVIWLWERNKIFTTAILGNFTFNWYGNTLLQLWQTTRMLILTRGWYAAHLWAVFIVPLLPEMWNVLSTIPVLCTVFFHLNVIYVMLIVMECEKCVCTLDWQFTLGPFKGPWTIFIFFI